MSDTPDAPPDDPRRLRRRRLSDGTQVYTGQLAESALDAVGARAMTLDRTILVREDLDPDDAEDAALVAHEQHHVEHSGGTGTHAEGDAEEQAAQAVESFVLHRRQQEEAAHDEPPTQGAPPLTAPDAAGHAQGPLAAYQALLATGVPHDRIVEQLAHDVLHELTRHRRRQRAREGR